MRPNDQKVCDQRSEIIPDQLALDIISITIFIVAPTKKLPRVGSLYEYHLKRVQSAVLVDLASSVGLGLASSVAGFSETAAVFSVLLDLSTGDEERPEGER